MRNKIGLVLVSSAAAGMLLAYGCKGTGGAGGTAGVKDITTTSADGEKTIAFYSEGGEVRRGECAAGAEDTRACSVTHKRAIADFKAALGKSYMEISKLKALSAAQSATLDLVMADLANPKATGLAGLKDTYQIQDYTYFVGLFDTAIGAAAATQGLEPNSATQALAGNSPSFASGIYTTTVQRFPGAALGGVLQINPAATGGCIQFNFVNCQGLRVIQANVAGVEGGQLLPTGGANDPNTGRFCSIQQVKTFAWLQVMVQNTTQFVQTCQLQFQIVDKDGGFTQGGQNQGGQAQGGFSQGGQNQGGISQGGFNQGGQNQGGFNQGGQNQGGQNQGGQSQGGFNQGGFNQGGFNQGGFNQGGFNQGGQGGQGGQPGGVGAACNMSIFPQKTCQQGLTCVSSGVPGANGVCQQANNQGGFNQGGQGQGGFNQGGQGGQGGFNQGGQGGQGGFNQGGQGGFNQGGNPQPQGLPQPQGFPPGAQGLPQPQGFPSPQGG